MSYSVDILPQAENDFEEIYLYISQQSPKGADAWANAFYKKLKQLESNPGAFGFAPENKYHSFELRQLIFRTRRGMPYRVLYSIHDKQVLIRHIRGTGEDYI